MGQETDVRFAYTSLGDLHRPDIPWLWKNQDLIIWARDAGYQSVEFHSFRAAAQEVLKQDIEIVASLDKIKSGHVIFNPYATVWKVLARKQDPLRPGRKLDFYNLALASNKTAMKALHKLEEKVSGKFPVVTYPFEESGENPYGKYKTPLLQTHPSVFNDERTAEILTMLVKLGIYSGVVWDTVHALEATESGHRPLGDYRDSLVKLLEAGVIKEVHMQLGRTVHLDPFIDNLRWLKDATGESPRYNNDLGQMLRIVKEHDPSIPIVIEVQISGLIQTGMLKLTDLLDPKLEAVAKIHQQLVHYAKAA
ncbi:MAG: hypothetical protein Q7S03_03685 [bacterium]|nr:hypothetical protein [bacterium]